MNYPNRASLLAICCLLFTGLTEAASPYTSFFNAYEQTFRHKHPYLSHQVPRGPYQLHAREFGVGNNGPTIIMMHGFPDSLHLYDLIAPEVAEERHVIVFDFLGWGASDKPYGFDHTIAEQITDLQAVVDYFNLQQVILVMHDASGPPAIDWALENRDKIAGLVLLNTYYGPMLELVPPEAVAFYATPSPERDWAIQTSLLDDGFWIQGYTDQIEKFFARRKYKDRFLKILTHQSLDIRPAFFSLVDKLFNDVGSRTFRQAQLASFDKPVQIIFGAEDPYLRPGVAREFHQLFPSSELHLLKGAGHFVQLDRPGAVAELIEEFLEEEDRD